MGKDSVSSFFRLVPSFLGVANLFPGLRPLFPGLLASSGCFCLFPGWLAFCFVCGGGGQRTTYKNAHWGHFCGMPRAKRRFWTVGPRFWGNAVGNSAFGAMLGPSRGMSQTKRRCGPVEPRCSANASGNVAFGGHGGVFLGGRLGANDVFRALNPGFGRMPRATGHVGPFGGCLGPNAVS